MAADKGGLQYAIEIRDLFTKSIRDFREGIRGAKKEWTDFKKASEGRVNSAKSFKETKKAIDEEREALKKLDADSKAQSKRERDLNKIRSSLRRDEAKERQRLQAIERQAASESNRLITEQQKRLRAFFAERNRAERESAKISKQLRKDEAAELLRQQRDLKANLDARNRAEKDAARIRAQLQKDEQNNLKAFVAARNRAEKEAARISASLKKDLAAKQQADPAFIAQERNTKAIKEELIVRNQILQLRKKAAQQFSQGDLIGGSKTLKQVQELQHSLESVNRSGNNLFFTFRRLVGVLALFTIARNLVQGFQDLVSEGLAFTDSIKQAEISIAGLISATAEVRDEMGKSVDASKEFALSQIIARDQVKKLQQDAFKTSGTLQDLAETFQVAIAPGFRAGLNIDEIRKLTVGISQAGAAIGVEQNQLAEEIRSILSGTIQARTTRIATALGISNEDIRRLKETGQLFDFLDKKLSAFGKAQEAVVRSTLAGVSGLVKKGVQQILGEAALPLFEELRKLGIALFDEVLTVRDALGNIQVNPKIVVAVREIFDALASGVVKVKEFAQSLGFSGVTAAFKAVGLALATSIQFAIGFAQTFLVTLKTIVATVETIANFFGLTTKQVGNLAGAFGVVTAATILWKNSLGLIGLNFTFIGGLLRTMIPALDNVLTKLEAGGGAAKVIGANISNSALGILGLAAVLAVALKGFQAIESAIFGVSLGLKDTVQITVLGLIGSLAKGMSFLAQLGRSAINSIKEIAFTIQGKGSDFVQGTKVLLASLRGDQKEVERLFAEQDAINVVKGNEKKIRDNAFILDQIQAENDALAGQAGLQAEIAKIVGDAAGRDAQGAGFDPTFDLDKFEKAQQAARDLKSGMTAFVPIISTAAIEIDALNAEMDDLEKQLRDASIEFLAVRKNAGLTGTASQIASIFTQRDVDNAEKLKKIQSNLVAVNADIARGIEFGNERFREEERLKALKQTVAVRDRLAALNAQDVQDQATAHSLLTDRKNLEDDIGKAESETLKLAESRAALLAVEATPQVRTDNIQAGVELAAERALLVVQQQRLGARRQATVEAQNAVNLAKAELGIQLQQLKTNLADLQAKAALATGQEGAALNSLVAQLQQQLALQKLIGDAKIRSLTITQAEAALVESGTLTEGIKRGFKDLGNDLPTAFLAGITVIKSAISQLTAFASTAIIDGLVGDSDESIEERFGQLAKSLANQLLQALFEVQLQKLISGAKISTIEQTSAEAAALIKTTAALTAAQIEVQAATTASIIRASSSIAFSQGGIVPQTFAKGGRVLPNFEHFSKKAEGFARGTPSRPRHIPQSDTIPAWLTPGEFVVRKQVVKSLGVDFFRNINRGNFKAPLAHLPSPGHAEAGGMAKGGLISDNVKRTQSPAAQRTGAQQDFAILPVQVAREKDFERQVHGGRNAMLRFLRENGFNPSRGK